MPRRGDPRSALRENLRLPGDARDWRGGSDSVRKGYDEGQASAEKAGARGGARLQFLWQSDRSCDRLCERDLPSGLCRETDGNRGGYGRCSQKRRAQGFVQTRRRDHSAGRKDRPRRDRRSHRLLQGAHGSVHRSVRSGSPERKCSHRAQAAENVPPSGGFTADPQVQ